VLHGQTIRLSIEKADLAVPAREVPDPE